MIYKILIGFGLLAGVWSHHLGHAEAAAESGETVGNPAYEMIIGSGPFLKKKDRQFNDIWVLKVGGKVQDVRLLSNGNLLFSNNDIVSEITPDGNSVWTYKTQYTKGDGNFSAQRLSDGSTVVSENSTGLIVTLDQKGVVRDSFLTVNITPGAHLNIRQCQPTPQGTYLVCHVGEHKVREYTPNGKVVWTLDTKGKVKIFKALRLKNGNTMVSSFNALTEFSPEGKEVWEFKNTDIPGMVIHNMVGFEILPNGNYFICCYNAYQKDGGNTLFEITRDKKLVWRYSRPKLESTVVGIDVVPQVEGSGATTSAAEGKPAYDIIVGPNGTLKKKDRQFNDTWSLNVGGLIHDLTRLPNGNILYANGNCAAEITAEGKQVWIYKPVFAKGGGPYSVQRMPNGSTVIGENSTGDILEVDPKGNITDSFKTLNITRGSHGNLRLVRKTPQGTYLVCHSGENTVREYTKTGNVVWTQKTKGLAFKAVRLPNGNTMISSLNQLTEYAPNGTIVWEFNKNDIPGIPIHNMTGFQILPNGNYLIGCYAAYQKGEGSAFFEITRDKKLVWRYSQPKTENTVMALDAIQ